MSGRRNPIRSAILNHMWRTSSYSAGNGQCVEVGGCQHAVQVRDSKDPGGPVLTFTPGMWRAFLARVKRT